MPTLPKKITDEVQVYQFSSKKKKNEKSLKAMHAREDKDKKNENAKLEAMIDAL